MTTAIRPARFWLFMALVLAVSGSLVGCNPQMLNFVLMPFVDDKEPPKCKLASPDKKEVTVAIITSFAGLETRPEMMPIESELSERVAAEMRKLAKESKEKIQFVSSSKVRGIMNQDASGSLSRQDIGQKLKADFVIDLQINSMTLFEKGSSNTLFSGRTEIVVTCMDVSKPRGEGVIFQEIYPRVYPGARGPIDAGSSSVLEFRTQFLNVISQELARYFLPYQAIRRMD